MNCPDCNQPQQLGVSHPSAYCLEMRLREEIVILCKQLDSADLQISELQEALTEERKRFSEMFDHCDRQGAELGAICDERGKELEAANRLIGAWQEYAGFLGVAAGNLALFAADHGWKCPPEVAAKDSALRAKLGVDDNWQLIEKRNPAMAVPGDGPLEGAHCYSCQKCEHRNDLHDCGCHR